MTKGEKEELIDLLDNLGVDPALYTPPSVPPPPVTPSSRPHFTTPSSSFTTPFSSSSSSSKPVPGNRTPSRLHRRGGRGVKVLIPPGYVDQEDEDDDMVNLGEEEVNMEGIAFIIDEPGAMGDVGAGVREEGEDDGDVEAGVGDKGEDDGDDDEVVDVLVGAGGTIQVLKISNTYYFLFFNFNKKLNYPPPSARSVTRRSAKITTPGTDRPTRT